MAKKMEVKFQPGDRITACPQAMKCPNKSGKITAHTRLTEEELKGGIMHVANIHHDGQLIIKHEKFGGPFKAHPKYFVKHPQHQAAATA